MDNWLKINSSAQLLTFDLMELNAMSLWHSVCGELEVQMTPASFNGWIKPCYIRSITAIDAERLIIELATPSSYHSKTVDEKYYAAIKQVVEKQTQRKCEIALVVDTKKPAEVKEKQQVTWPPCRAEPRIALSAVPELERLG